MSDTARDQAIAQVNSIAAMVAALDVDYERLKELREKASEGHYIAGWNMPGYMPGYMPDSEPAAFDTADEARAYIIEEIKHEEGQAETESEAETLCAFAEDVNLQRGEFSAQCLNYVYWVTHEPGKLADPDEAEELAELEQAAGDCKDQDEARQRIEEDPLSVELRSGWASLGETLEPAEFRIVLCTGGPHVELVGDLDRGEPCSVRVIYKDWGECGELFDFDHDVVLRYCQCFYFGI